MQFCNIPFAISLRKVCISHLFLQKGSFPHSLSSFFLSSSQLLFLPSPLLLYETLSLCLLLCSLLCLPALQLFTTPPGHVINFNTTVHNGLPLQCFCLEGGHACYLSVSSLCRRSCSSLSLCSRASLLFSARRREASSGSVALAEGLHMT